MTTITIDKTKNAVGLKAIPSLVKDSKSLKILFATCRYSLSHLCQSYTDSLKRYLILFPVKALFPIKLDFGAY